MQNIAIARTENFQNTKSSTIPSSYTPFKLAVRLLLGIVMILSVGSAWGQTTFTTPVNPTGNWTGIAWTKTGTTTTATYPGQVNGENHIVVINVTGNGVGRVLTLDQNITQSVSNVSINYTGTRTATLSIGNFNLTMTGNLTGIGIITIGSGTLNIAGNNNHTGTFNCGTGTVNYNGAGAQSVGNYTYFNLSSSTGGIKTLPAANININGDLSISNSTLAFNAAAARTITVIGNLSGNGTIDMSSGNRAHILDLGGTTNAIGTLTTAAIASNVNYTRTGDQTMFGSPNYRNVTISGGGNKSLQANATINGTLTLTNGNLTLGNNDLTIVNPVSGTFNNTHMVITDGTGGLVKQGSANSDFVLTYPIGTGTTYTPITLSTFSATSIAPGSTLRLQSSTAPSTGAPGNYPLNRHWNTSTNGISGSVIANISFGYLASDIPTGGTASLYEIIYKPTLDNWTLPNGSGIAGSNPLLASSATTLDAEWTAVVPVKRIFYSLKSGSWDDPTVWTLDPSGTQPLNPNNYTPTTSTTSIFDEVVVLSGRAVTVSSNNKQNYKLTVVGTIDFGITIGHGFTTTINGTGRIRLAGDNFPSGDATDFITAGQGEGTVEYYGVTRTITTPRTFFNVDVNMGVGNVLSLLANYTTNGSLTVSNGTLQINDNLSTIPLSIIVKGDIAVAASGKITTGSANARHQLNIYGNFTNSGDVRFTNRATADFATEATDGIVDANFLNTAASQSIFCRGITNFYRIKINKGVDNTFTLNIDATAPANFNLLGFANENHAAVAQLADNANALGLVSGTVRIGNSVVIPTLSIANVYSISEAAQLWINGGTVQKNIGQTIAIYGKIKTTTGLLEAKVASGVTLCKNGALNVDGGTVNINQLRTSDVGADPNNGAYVQSNGTVNVLGGTTNNDYYVFSLPSTASVFNMSGGTLKVNTAPGNGAILINSDPENLKITGGTVIGETTSIEDFLITSRAPFWNLQLKNSTAVARKFTLGAAANIGPLNINIAAQPLQVLNDLRIWGQESGGAAYPTITLDAALNDLYIGGSFYIEKGAFYTAITGGTAPYDATANQPTARNTTYFNKTAGTNAVEVFYIGETTLPLEIGKLVVDRTSGYEIKLTSGAARANESVALDVNGDASVLSGILNQNLFTIRTWGAITNNGRMGTWYPGVTPSRAQIQLVENPALTLTTSEGAIFGNVQINVTPPAKITFTSDVYIERMEYVKGLIYLKGYNLKVDNLWNMETGLFENSAANSYMKIANNGASGSSMIFTDGKASDGGLSIKITANSQAENQPNIINNFGPTTYPVGLTPNAGTTLYFRPAQVVVKGYSDDGYITIRPVFGSLQTTNQAGGEVLQHYWRVSHSDFTTVPTVAYRFYYRNQLGTANVDLPAGAVNEASYVPGKVLDESPYTRLYEPLAENDVIKAFGAGNNSRFITINGASTNGLFSPASAGITLENANYTTGVAARFTGSVLIYYTRDYQQEPRWTDGNAWTRSNILDPLFAPHDSRQPAAGSFPGAGDVAVIGWVPWNDAGRPTILGQPHGMWIDNNIQQVAEVVFTKMTDIGGNPVARVYRSNFQFRPTLCINQPAGQLVTKLVKGEGLFWNRQSDPNYTLMDIGDFARQDSSYVIYENFTNNRIINNTPALFPNLYISNDGWGSQNHNFTFTRDITTTGNVELLGNVNLLLPTGTTGNITAGRNLIMFVSQNSGSGAEIGYGNTGTARKIVVKGDLIMKNAGCIINVRTPNATAPLVDHELHVEGDIIQGTAALAPVGLDLWSGANNDRITLFLDGSSNMVYNRVSGNIPNLYRVVVNKGTSKATTAQFDTDFVLNGPTTGIGVAKALELKNGTFISNNPNAARILTLTSGNDYFDIPSTAGLTLLQGTARASGNSGISLDGTLTISGGTLDMASSGGENPIEYSASGSATINISSGNLNVGGQIRRSLTSDAGVLHFAQTGGTVVAGQNAASANNRGVFEILNAGSSFTMTGGDLFIARAQTSPEISAFYFNPASYSIGLAANINIGHTSTPAGQTIGIYAGKPLPKLRVNNQSTRNPIAKLEVVPTTITSNLLIDANATFNANGLDLIIKGDMTSSGTFLANGNTTFLSGTSTQTITSNGSAINFYNLDKTGSNSVVLNGANTPLLISNELFLRAGTFTTTSNTVTVRGNMLNDATHIYGAGDGIALNGTTTQILTGNGTFGKLTINNLNGIDVPVANQFKIINSLKMQSGVFNIGKNLLDLGVSASIEQASPFSNTNMITTNISFTDNGLRKTFPAGAQPNFIFPVGSSNKYTPVTIAISANGNSTGSITVKPANEIHPSILEDAESVTQITDKDNALQYYWTLKASGISGFSAAAKMRYIDTDVKVTPPYSVADYHTASLLANGLGSWLKFPKTDFDEATKDLIFNFTLKNDAGISGDYTAGAGDASLNGAIPDQVSIYETNSNGDWTTGTIWTPNVSGGPRGAIAKINAPHTVDVTTNNLAGYMTEIFGTLKLYSTYGHRLGIVNGTGTIYLEVGDIPAAVYDNFFSSAGGTLDFGGAGLNYEFLGNVLEVNNLKITGSGDRRFPNNNLILNGDLTIAGGAGLNTFNYYNRKLSVKGNITRTSGNYDAGSGANATIALIGSLPQSISGSFSNANALNNLEVNNVNDVNILNDVEIDRELKLTNGLVNITPGSLFRLNYNAFVTPTAGSPLSFVNGTLTKEMITGNSFTFPIGNFSNTKAHGPIALQNVSGPAGINDWNAAYFYANPDLAGYSTANFGSPITTVSHSEYWKIQAPTGGQSTISIFLDGSSDVASTIPDLANLRIVGWNGATNKWEVVGTGASVSGTSTNGTITTTSAVNFGSYSYFTLASVTPLSASSASFTSPGVVNLCNGSSTTMVVAFSGTPPWVLTYKVGATNVTTPALATSPYSITVAPSATTVYTLTGITANGVAGTITGTTSVTVNVSPIPTIVLSSSPALATICQGTSITFTATAGLTNYRFRVNGATIQNGASNTYTTSTLAVGTQSVDVIGTNAGACSSTSSAIAVTVNPLPVAAGTISGPASVCRASTQTYSVPAIANATSYTWTRDNGATGASTTNSINLTFPTAGTTTITVRGVNGCGNGTVSTFTVAVNTASTPAAAGAISGPSEICKGATGYTYTVPAVTNATSYIWSYSGGGATITGTGNSVTIDFSAAATNGNLTVAGTNGCSTGTASANYPITAFTPPTATIAPASPSTCSGTPITLTATPTGGALPYTLNAWTGTGAASLSNTTTTNPSFTNATGGAYDLTYTVTDTKGCVGTASTTVTVFQAPVAEAGPNSNVCTGTAPIALTGASAGGSYTGTPTWSGAGGTWTQNPNPALATFTPAAASGTTTATLTLTGANGCSNATDTRTITWNKTPDQPAAYTASKASVCQGESNVVYTVPNDPLVTTYTWSYTVGTGATITGTGNSVLVSFGATATSGKLNVTATNSCGTSTARTIDITVNTTPSAVKISGNASTCAGQAGDGFSVTNNATWTYLWSIEDNIGTVTLPGNTSSVTVTWKPNAAIFIGPLAAATSVSKKVFVVVNTTPAGCPVALEWDVTIHRLPETGPQYHVPNDFAQ
ncbi:beta strand repeat-containing protein [Williamwhitmania taraxaci]|uniref:PKD domain-containing protein n=1 Tax=Williamwhitmania taraxaci TaxID=1640674 RepID=A0A1G6GHA5_9BACT|nr:hypothetical protein [Williamwhitmania taraxaci]SDB81330.1 hypothetical protein SAMN05216323_100159 [Williamwhitmania taraxaci]